MWLTGRTAYSNLGQNRLANVFDRLVQVPFLAHVLTVEVRVLAFPEHFWSLLQASGQVVDEVLRD